MWDIPIGEVKFRISKTYLLKGSIERKDKTLFIETPFNLYLKDEIKAMDGARWHGKDDTMPRKAWSVHDSIRNRFQLAYLLDMNPYAQWDKPLIDFKPRRGDAYQHQNYLTAATLTHRHLIIAGDMGIGKSRVCIEAIEYALINNLIKDDVWWVGPKSALASVRYEFRKWNALTEPRFLTYDELKKEVQTWEPGNPAPSFIVFDEAHKLKTYTSQRSQAARHIADSIREEYGFDSFIVLMSGTPSPKSPADWWSLAEIAAPGFIREGNLQKFQNRLALINKYEGTGGGFFPKLITWWDNENKCAICGKFQHDPDHDSINMIESWYHPYKKSVNEVHLLYKRMKGLVEVKLKKDLLDLPEKIYKRLIAKPSDEILRAADLIKRTAPSTIKALTLLRELSDGFQYQQTEDGVEVCSTCNGLFKISTQVDADDPDNPLDSESLTRGHRAIWKENDDGTKTIDYFKEEPLRLIENKISCPQCNERGFVPRYTRTVARVPCPKDEMVIDLLDQYEDEGRVVFWAGFTDSVNRCAELCIKQGWPVICVDGRGWWHKVPGLMSIARDDEILEAFSDRKTFEKIAWVGQPGAGGLGVNLTASSMEAYYSNTFKFDDRAQSEDRIHRPGADHNRGCTIYDLIHLHTDLYVLENLLKKRNLMTLSLGEFQTEVLNADLERVN